MEEKNRLTFKQYLILAVVSVSLFVALWNFNTVLDNVYALLSYLLPLFIGGCLAFAINVPMKAFEKLFAFIQRKCRIKVRHTLNTYISLVFTVATIGGAVFLFAKYMAPQLASSAVEIADKAKQWYPDIVKFLKSFGVDTDYAEDLVNNFNVEKVLDFLKEHVSLNPDNVVDTVINAASSTVSVFISGVSCIIFSVYMITGKKKLNLQARQLVYAYTPKNVADKLCHIGSLTYKTFYNFISSQCLDALVLATLLFGAMLLFDLPYAGIICTLTGVCALIPYVGALLSCVIGALLILIVSPIKALIFLAVFMVVQQIEGQLIYPHLVGGSIGLPAIWTLFAALVGGELMGLFGLLTFIPLTAVVYTLIKEGAFRRLKQKGIVVESPVETAEKEKQRLLMEKVQKKREHRAEKKRLKTEKKLAKKQRKDHSDVYEDDGDDY